MSLALALWCVLFPAAAWWGARRFKALGALGPVVLCYAAGIALANLPGLRLDPRVSRGLSEAAVPLAIPLLLFSTDLKRWVALARPLLLAFALACVASVVAAAAAGLLFRARTDEWWKVAGMLVGVYVGGTPNMSAVGLALGVRQSTFVLLNASDVVAGGAYLLVLLTVAQRLALKVLKPYARGAGAVAAAAAPAGWTRRDLPGALAGFALAAALVGASAGLSWALTGALSPALVLLGLTTLALGASLSARVRGWAGAAVLGEYVLLVFCVAVGTLADVRQLAGASLTLFLFVCLVMSLAVAVHVALARLFGVDADTALICSTATIYGPAFIGPVAAALKNRELVGPGITLGLAGLALGTYLGLGTAWALRALAG